LLDRARALHQMRTAFARRNGEAQPMATRLYEDVEYQAGSWPKAYRVVLKAEMMALGDNPRFVVTSLTDPTPELLYTELYCARGQDENFIKAMKNDSHLRPHLRSWLPGQPSAPVLFVRGLCADSRPARQHPGPPHGTGPRAADVDHPETVQAGGAGGAVQGSHQALVAQRLSGEGAAGARDRNSVPRATTSCAGLSSGIDPSCHAYAIRPNGGRGSPATRLSRTRTVDSASTATRFTLSAIIARQNHPFRSHSMTKMECVQHQPTGL
jgi:Transposase DDE domain group 1